MLLRPLARPHSLLLLALLAACGAEPGAADKTADVDSADPGTADDPSDDTGEDADTDSGADSGAPTEPDFPFELADPPFDVPDGVRFAPDVAYDIHDQTGLDILLPAADDPMPLVIYIHGGGFTGGDKASLYSDADATVLPLLEAGAAVATINYRLLEEVDAEGVAKPLHDSRRALQFLRHHHSDLHIDPDRVVLFGGSAGAGTSLWLGTHDDMADPDADDPIEHESTRVRAVAITATQATYDLFRWPEIFAEYALDIYDLGAIAGEQRLLSFYGVSTRADLVSPETEAYRADVDMLGLMDSSDAPVWIQTNGDVEEPTDTGVLYHHPFHARAVMERAEATGLEHAAYIPALGIEDDRGESMVDFLLRHVTE